MSLPSPISTSGSLPLSVLGAALQSISLGLFERGDKNTSFVTRAIGIQQISLLFILGTTLAFIFSSTNAVINLSFLIPLIRFNLVLSLCTRLMRMISLAGRVRPKRVLYNNEVFPLQAAAMIWNNCNPIVPRASKEDERSIILDLLRVERDFWRPTSHDNFFQRTLRWALYVLLSILTLIISVIDFILNNLWQLLFERDPPNVLPFPLNNQQHEVLGHTLLISDDQLSLIHRLGMLTTPIDPQILREARRTVIRAVHIANLFTHSGFTRLPEHVPGGMAMSEYYAAIDNNELVKAALSATHELKVFPALPNGNRLSRGEVAPRQVLWARLVVGCLHALRGQARWRGPLAQAFFSVAKENCDAWGNAVNDAALYRHVYTVTRRLLVDWIMFCWWKVDVEDAIVEQPDEFFERIKGWLMDGLQTNTLSLPHAVGELIVASSRPREAEDMLVRLLGNDWELWLEQCSLPSGSPLREALESSGEWKCVGRPITADVAVESYLYQTKGLRDVLATDASATVAEQARACLSNRLVDTLLQRVKAVWMTLPLRLVDAPDVTDPNLEI